MLAEVRVRITADTSALDAALTRLIEANARRRKRRALAKLERELEAAMAKEFRAQGLAFLARLALLKGRFPPAVREVAEMVPWEPLFDEAALESIEAYRKPLSEFTERALDAGMRAAVAELSVETSFTLEHPAAVDYLKQRGAEQVTGINQTTRERLRTILTQAADEGWSYQKTAREIRKRYGEMAVTRARNIAVFECLPGDTLVRPFAFQPGTLPLSVTFPAFRGLAFQALIDTPAGHCVGDRSQSAILGATRRWYVGPLIHVATAGGHQLAGTPNHPVLTDRGWIGLGLLAKGDHVVCGGGAEAVGLGHPNIEDVPTPIGQVFDALRDAHGTLLQRITGSDRDFHGDGMEGEVDIVWSVRHLSFEYQATLRQPIDHLMLALPDLASRNASCLSAGSDGTRVLLLTLAHPGDLAHAAFGGGVGILEERSPLLRGSARPFELDVFGGFAEGNARFDETVTDGIDGDAIDSGDGAHGLPGSVAFDEIVDVEIREFRGHVYNLITSHGSYAANGIILQNCGDAYEHGNLLVGKDLQGAGLVMQKSWLSVGDARVRPAHQANQAQGWIDLDAAFQDGSERPPADSGCRCTLLQRRKPDA